MLFQPKPTIGTDFGGAATRRVPTRCVTSFFGKANFSNTFRFLGINRVQAKDGRFYDHMKPYIQTMLADYKNALGMNPKQPLRKYTVPFSQETANTPDAIEPSTLTQQFPQYDPLHLVRHGAKLQCIHYFLVRQSMLQGFQRL